MTARNPGAVLPTVISTVQDSIPQSQLPVLPADVAGAAAVELSCGSGYVSAWLARRGAHPVGVDVSARQPATAHRLRDEFGLRFPLVQAHAERVPFGASCADLVISEYGASVWFSAHEGRYMPYIALNSAEPGIRGLLRYRPETGRPLSELTEVLLRGPGTLTRGERELIAAYVSALNDCRYCPASHSACAAAQLPGGMVLVEQVRSDADSAPAPAKLKALLAIAAAVQQGGLAVTAELVAQAQAADATDLEIHDTVLIAAVFCMFNRYVDGLATIAREDPALYAAGAQRLIKDGYLPPSGEPSRQD